MNFSRQLLKKLIRNALENLGDEMSEAGCNDLFPDDTLLKGVTPAERKVLDAFFVENVKNQNEHDPEDNEISMDVDLLTVIEQMLDNTELVDGHYKTCEAILKEFKEQGFDVKEVYSEVDDSCSPEIGFVVVINEVEPNHNTSKYQTAEFILRDYACRIEWTKKLRKIKLRAKA